MANHKSAAKRARQNTKRRANNRMKKSAMRTAVKKLDKAISEGNKEMALTLYTKAQSLLSKVSKCSAMNKKTAARLTSRLAARVNKV